MKNNTTARFRTMKAVRYLAIALIVVVAIFCILLNFGDGVSFPNWETIFDSTRISAAATLEESSDFFRVVNVGQGDCLLLYSKGCVAMVDTGPKESEQVLRAKLKQYGVSKIDLLIFSHMDSDHSGNAEMLAKEFHIRSMLTPFKADPPDDPTGLLALRDAVLSAGGGVYNGRQGMSLTVGDFEITDLLDVYDAQSTNNQMMYLMVRHGNKHILLTGDGEETAEERLLSENLKLSCDILKVAHHGSNTSTSKKLLKACTPKYSVISVGAGNKFGHPTDAVLQRLESSKTELYRTDMDGDITFYFEGDNIEIKTEN